MIAEAFVVLHLKTWDADKGLLLEAREPVLPIALGPKIESCREFGVEVGRRMTAKWQVMGYRNVFTNVDCEWDRSGRGA